MTRITGPNATAAGMSHVEPRLLVRIDSSGSEYFICSGNSDITHPDTSDVYTAVGGFGSVDSVFEDTDLRPSTIRMTLSGVDSALLSEATTQAYSRGSVQIFVAFLNPATLQLVDSPYEVFFGQIDQMSISMAANEAAITLTAQDEFARWGEARQLLFTDAEQRRLWSGDTGLDQVVFIQNRNLVWGGGTQAAGTPSSPVQRNSRFGRVVQN